MSELTPTDPPKPIAELRSRTPARVLTGRAGTSYRTTTLLDLRQDHAAAIDAVRAEIDLARDLGSDFVTRWGILEIATLVRDRAEYLARPDLGRSLAPESAAALAACPRGVTLQVIIGDGLSAAAVVAQVPELLPLLAEGAERRGWSFGRPVFIRHCRVGILNAIGARLDPHVVVLFIGERPGLATADSLSAYMAYRPRPGQTDADRNLISNIHTRGTTPIAAVERVLELAAQMKELGQSGVTVKERNPLPVPPLRSTAPIRDHAAGARE